MKRIPILVAAVALTTACGSRDATEKQLAELRAEVVKARAEGAVLSDRLDALERSRTAPAAAPSRPADPDRPLLDIVRLTPEASLDAPASDGRGAAGTEPPVTAPPRRADLRSSPPPRRTP